MHVAVNVLHSCALFWELSEIGEVDLAETDAEMKTKKEMVVKKVTNVV